MNTIEMDGQTLTEIDGDLYRTCEDCGGTGTMQGYDYGDEVACAYCEDGLLPY